MVPCTSCLHHIFNVVVGRHILVLVQVVAVGTAQSEIFSHTLSIGVTICFGIAPGLQHVIIRIHGLQSLGVLLNLVVHVVLHLCNTFTLGSFRGHKNNTISTTGTVDGC